MIFELDVLQTASIAGRFSSPQHLKQLMDETIAAGMPVIEEFVDQLEACHAAIAADRIESIAHACLVSAWIDMSEATLLPLAEEQEWDDDYATSANLIPFRYKDLQSVALYNPATETQPPTYGSAIACMNAEIPFIVVTTNHRSSDLLTSLPNLISGAYWGRQFEIHPEIEQPILDTYARIRASMQKVLEQLSPNRIYTQSMPDAVRALLDTLPKPIPMHISFDHNFTCALAPIIDLDTSITKENIGVIAETSVTSKYSSLCFHSTELPNEQIRVEECGSFLSYHPGLILRDDDDTVLMWRDAKITYPLDIDLMSYRMNLEQFDTAPF